MVWAAPPKTTVLVPAVKFAPVPPQAVVLVAFSLIMLEPPLSVPAVRVTTPVNVCVKPAPRLSVPPAPLMVSAAPFTLPVNVAVPAVLVKVVVPVVVKPPIEFVTNVPEIVTPPEPEYVPLFTKLQLASVNK